MDPAGRHPTNKSAPGEVLKPPGATEYGTCKEAKAETGDASPEVAANEGLKWPRHRREPPQEKPRQRSTHASHEGPDRRKLKCAAPGAMEAVSQIGIGRLQYSANRKGEKAAYTSNQRRDARTGSATPEE
jgi:hypothetical protein